MVDLQCPKLLNIFQFALVQTKFSSMKMKCSFCSTARLYNDLQITALFFKQLNKSFTNLDYNEKVLFLLSFNNFYPYTSRLTAAFYFC